MACSLSGCPGNSKMPYQCNRCGETFCSDHRLPENHNCRGSSSPGTRVARSGGGRTGFSKWLLAFGILLVAAVGVYAAGPIDSVGSAEVPEIPIDDNSTDQNSSGLWQQSDGLNETEVELKIHAEINRYRTQEGVGNLSYDQDLAEIAAYHSSTMASHGEIFHESPSGETYEDRYQKFGYDCEVPAGDNRYYTGAENVAKTWYEEELTNGEYYSTPEELAEGIAKMWFNSQGHRENMLRSEWRSEGIGVNITEEDGKTAIYVTQNFC